MLSLLDNFSLGGLSGGGLPALNELTSYAFLLSNIPGVSDTEPPLAFLAPVADLVPTDFLATSNGLAIPEGLISIPSGLPFLGVGLPGGFPPAIVDDLLSAGSVLTPLSSLLAPEQPNPTLGVLQPISGFLLF